MMKRLTLPTFACFLLSGLSLAHAQHTKFLNPPELSKPNGYSHIVIVNRGKLIIISGQTGFNGKGEIQQDFAGQTKQAFDNLGLALSAAGANPADLVKLNYYVVGLDHQKLLALRVARDRFIDPEHPPASTLVDVQSLVSESMQIEIDAEAVKPQRRTTVRRKSYRCGTAPTCVLLYSLAGARKW